jgi:hypothetical protein
MNIENISALGNQLQTLGFGDLGYPLLKRICFKLNSFSISHKIEKGKDQLNFEIYFEKKDSSGAYVLKYYDAMLLQEELQWLDEISGVNIPSLEKLMSTIDWKKAFELNEQKPWDADNNSAIANETKIESVITELHLLETTDEGKSIASALKLKYWAGSAYTDLFGVITGKKNKSEINQRFFIFEGQPGISVDEAYRFLLNRRLEKQLKKKQNETPSTETSDDEVGGNSGSGLLKKKRINGGIKKGKYKATAQ